MGYVSMLEIQLWNIVFSDGIVDYTAGQHTFCMQTKISYFEDFLMLKMIGTFILLCKLAKTAKKYSQTRQKGHFGYFLTPLAPHGGFRGSNRNMPFKALICGLSDRVVQFSLEIHF